MGGRAWRKQESIIRAVIENNPAGKTSVEVVWEDCVTRHVEMVRPGPHWRKATEDRERWENICLEGWSKRRLPNNEKKSRLVSILV